MDANLKAEILRAVFEHENRIELTAFFALSLRKGWNLRSSNLDELICSQELALVDNTLVIPNPQAYYASLTPPVVRRPTPVRKRK